MKYLLIVVCLLITTGCESINNSELYIAQNKIVIEESDNSLKKRKEPVTLKLKSTITASYLGQTVK